MQFAVIRFEYSLARERDGGPPIFIDVEGTPETVEEVQQYRGVTRETLTLAECEARNIALPAVLADINADMAKRLTASEASIVSIIKDASGRVAEADQRASAAEREAQDHKRKAETAEAVAADLSVRLEQAAVSDKAET